MGIVLGEAIDEVVECFDACLGSGEGFGNVIVEVAGGGGGGGVGCAGEGCFVHDLLIVFCTSLLLMLLFDLLLLLVFTI